MSTTYIFLSRVYHSIKLLHEHYETHHDNNTTGGAYGFVRVTLGPHAGNWIAGCETLSYLLHAALCVHYIGLAVTKMTRYSVVYEPIYWVLTYSTMLLTHLFTGSYIWRITTILFALSALVLAVYCIATSPEMNFATNVLNSPVSAFKGTTTDFMEHLPYAMWFFFGLSSVPLASEYAAEVCFIVTDVH